MRLISGMFWASTLVMSRGHLITAPTFVRGAVDDSVLGALALEACIPGKWHGSSFRRGWGAVHNNQVSLRPVGN